MQIKKVWTDATSVYAMTTEGLVAKYDFEEWPTLSQATDEQRSDFYLSYSGIHWPLLDEDLSFEGMFAKANLCTRTTTEDSVVYVG